MATGQVVSLAQNLSSGVAKTLLVRLILAVCSFGSLEGLCIYSRYVPYAPATKPKTTARVEYNLAFLLRDYVCKLYFNLERLY